MGTRSQRFPRVCLRDCFHCSCCKFKPAFTGILEPDKELFIFLNFAFHILLIESNGRDSNFAFINVTVFVFCSLLNANKIACLRVDAFQDLHNLNLLSLYDNKLQTIAKGTFASLRAIQTLYVNIADAPD